MIKRKTLPVLLMLICLMVHLMPMAGATEIDEDARRGLDYSELELQVGIANGLNAFDYTKESWEPLQKALEVGNKRLAGIYDQGKLDNAAKDIEAALGRLVKMNYAPLNKALNEVNEKIAENPQHHDVWYRIDKAVEEARPLLVSGDQQAVNEAAQKIDALLEELSACDKITVPPEIVIQEVEVEVLPTDDFCNIPMHRTWQVLFFLSAALNVLLIAVLGYVVMKKRTTVDNTPLVDYDIDDDFDY